MADVLPSPAAPETLGPGLPKTAEAAPKNMFDDIDPQAGAATPHVPNMFDDLPDTASGETGATGAFISHAARGVLPMVGGMAAAGAVAEAGAELGGAIGGAIGGPPGALAGAGIGGFAGGLGGFFFGSAATQGPQDWGLKELPMAAQEALGQSDRAQREQEQEHPYASFMGGIAPYAITMSPGGWAKAAASLPKNATAFQKIMANPITQKAFSGAMMGGMELRNEWVEGRPPDWTNVAISTGFGLVFSRENRAGEYLTNLGAQPVARLFAPHMAVPPAGVLNPEEPTVAQAGDVGVLGPGITEQTFRGGEQQSDAARATVQNAAADEQAALGPLPTPDLDAIARRLEPDTFARNDELLGQRDALRSWIQNESAPPDEAFDALDSKRAEVEAALGYANPNSPDARNLRAQLKSVAAQREDLQARRDAWEAGTHVDTQDIMLARQHLLDTEHALWDLAPDVSAARRRAADHVGEPEPEAAQPVAEQAAEQVPEKEGGFPEAAPAEKSPEAQRAFITADRATQLMAAGLSRPTAEASAAVEAHYYSTLSARFGGALGTAEDLYRARAARVVGPGQTVPTETAPPITRTEPLKPPTIRSIADIQAQEGVGASKAKRIQEQEILAKGRVIVPGTPRGEPVAPVHQVPSIAPQVPSIPSVEGGPAPEPVAPTEARVPEPAEVAQAPVEATPPAPRPRLRSGADIASEDGIKDPDKIIAIQNQEMLALADWQAAHPSGEPRPKRNRVADRLAETAGIPTAGVPEPAVLAEIVDRLPEERVVEEVNAAAEAGEIEYREAEAAVPEATENPDTFYDADQSRPLEELESEHRPANETAAPEQREGGGGEPIPAAEGAGPVPEGGGPVEPVGGARGRAGGEATAGGATAAPEPGTAGEPGRAAEVEPAGVAPLLPTAAHPDVAAHTEGNGGLESLDPTQIGVDAARFQFKAGGDEAGVTERLEGVQTWDPRLAGTVLVFRDADGKDWIADGHQRLALAQRLISEGQQDVRLNAFVLDAKDGHTDADARAIAAAKNIAEGTGTSVDAAKIIRHSAESGIVLPPLPPRSTLVREGRALARLSPDAFGMVVNDLVPTGQGALVGRLVADAKQQTEAMRVLAKLKPDNLRQAETIVRDVMETSQEATTQGGLFGDEELAASATLERAQVVDAATRQLSRDRTTFHTLVSEAERIQGHGENVLDLEANRTRLSGDEQAKQLLTSLATTKGPVSDALTGIARRVRDGELTATAGAREFLGALRSHVARELAEGDHPRGAFLGAEREPELTPPDAHDTGPARDLLGELIREPAAARIPEPTIRNDDRQETMPGMGPSAVQAQAARDQAGRGALRAEGQQQAADEGLFAPKEEPSGELFQEKTLTWEELLERGRQTRQLAQNYAEAGKPAAFQDRHGIKYLVSRDLNYPPDGWRVTMFSRDDGQPTGHWEAKSAYEAFREVLAGQPEPIGENHPLTPGELFQRGLGAVPLYSPVERAVERLTQARGTGEQMLAQITRTAGVKPEEIKWLGLDDWLRGQKSVTKAEIADFIQANSLDVREVMLGAESTALDHAQAAIDQAAEDRRGGYQAIDEAMHRVGDVVEIDGDRLYADEVARGLASGSIKPADLPEALRAPGQQYVEAVQRHNAASDAYDAARDDSLKNQRKTRYGRYTLPGGKDYRELLITLPQKHVVDQALPYERWLDEQPWFRRGGIAEGERTRELYDEYVERNATGHTEVGYKSSHWDEPNVLAHIRFDERTAPDGAKTLLVHEAQSDWHQSGRKHGYQSDLDAAKGRLDALNQDYNREQETIARLSAATTEPELKELEQARGRQSTIIDQMNAIHDQETTARLGGQGIPDAPFKTSWSALAMKRMIKYAVDNGFDRIAWAPGEVQAARYDLSKQISNITLRDQGASHYLTATDHSGKQVIERPISDPEKELPDLIGKEAAEKLLSQERQTITLLPRVRQFDLEAESRPEEWRVTTPDGRAMQVGKGTVGTEEEAKEYATNYFNDRATEINKRREQAGATRELSGLDLKVGGEGMKGFYDKILPAEVNKIVGKFGGKVGTNEVPASYKDREQIKPDAQAIADHGPEWDRVTAKIKELESQRKPYGGNTPEENDLYNRLDDLHAKMIDDTMARGAQQPVHSLDITPQLRSAVESEGLPLFQAAQRLRQTVQASVHLEPGEAGDIIRMTRNSDASSFLHETAHSWLKQLMQDAMHALAPEALKADAATIRKWLKRPEGWTGFKLDAQGQIARDARGRAIPDVAPHERFARAFEQYLREGHAPSRALDGVFAQFKRWLTTIYQTLRGLGAPISDDIRGVFDRMLAIEPRERTTVGEVPDRGPSLAAIHEADAAETHPSEAGAVADRIAAERAQTVAQPPPEVANEVARQQPEPEAAGAAEPGAEAGPGAAGRGEVSGAGGQPQSVTERGGVGAGHGPVGEGRGGAEAEGGGLGGGTAEPGNAGGRRGAESAPRSPAEQLAPKPAEQFPTGESDAVDLAGNVRTRNIRDSDQFVQAAKDSAERNHNYDAVRGRGATMGAMIDLADSLNLDPATITEQQLGRIFGGVQDLGPQIWALRDIIGQQGLVVHDLWAKAAESKTPEDIAASAMEMARFDMMMTTLSGVTAKQGRNLGMSFRNMENWQHAKDLNQFMKDNTGKDLYQLQMIAKLGTKMDTPRKVSKMLQDAQKRSYGRMLIEYWVNGLISGLATHATYVVGNELLSIMKAGPETATAAAVGAFRASMGRTGTRVRFGEVGAQFGAQFREAPATIQAGVEALRSGATTQLPGEAARPLMPFQGDTELTMSRGMTNRHVTWQEAVGDLHGLFQGMRDGLVATGELVKAGGVEGAPRWGTVNSPLGAIPGVAYKGVEVLPLGHIARLPSRSVAAIHSSFRMMNYSMAINALAFRQAAEEGLDGEPFAARVAYLRQNPDEGMMETARGQATDLTLMSQGGKLTQALGNFFNKSYDIPLLGETPIFKFVDPFVHIAGNIMNQSIMQRTPVGILSREIRADLSGKNGNVAQDTAMAKMLVGTALAVTFGGLAAQGLVNGSGPSDPKKMAGWIRVGNQPHSMRIGNMWYQMNRLGPMGLLASVAADMYDVSHMMGTEDAATVGSALMHAFTQNILDESFMRGPADLIRATTESDRYGSAYIRNLLPSFLPFSVLQAQMARATDPYSRQARTIMDAIRARVPGLSETLFPRRDIWGEPMPSGDALIAPGVTAIYERQMSTDPVNIAMWNLGVFPGPVDRTIRNVKLTDQQYDDYARIAGRATKIRLDAIVQSPLWATMPNSSRYQVIEETLKENREAAVGEMFKKYPQIPRDAAKARIARKTGETVH